MKENICTIPINDIFNIKKGCPICSMKKAVESRQVEAITGDAMMEPSVRIETNQKGFCLHHFSMMYLPKNNQANGLLLESHLKKISEDLEKSKDAAKLLDSFYSGCYVCNRIESEIYHFFRTIFVEFEKNIEFKELFNNQDFVCINHYKMLLDSAKLERMNKKTYKEFEVSLNKLTLDYIKPLKEDISYYCSMFQYYNKGKDWKSSKDAVERAIAFLQGVM